MFSFEREKVFTSVSAPVQINVWVFSSCKQMEKISKLSFSDKPRVIHGVHREIRHPPVWTARKASPKQGTMDASHDMV